MKMLVYFSNLILCMRYYFSFSVFYRLCPTGQYWHTTENFDAIDHPAYL